MIVYIQRDPIVNTLQTWLFTHPAGDITVAPPPPLSTPHPPSNTAVYPWSHSSRHKPILAMRLSDKSNIIPCSKVSRQLGFWPSIWYGVRHKRNKDCAHLLIGMEITSQHQIQSTFKGVNMKQQVGKSYKVWNWFSFEKMKIVMQKQNGGGKIKINLSNWNGNFILSCCKKSLTILY